MTAAERLTEAVAKGAIKAFGEIARKQGVSVNALDFDRVSVTLKATMQRHIDDGSMLSEWRELAESVIGDGWQQMALSAQAWTYAQEAWSEYSAA
jgi:hypothetical protein